MMHRSLLFVPGDRPERFDKAVATGADLVVIDLEDAVAPERKAEARQAANRWLAAGGHAALRVNPPGSAEYSEDCAMAAGRRCVAVMLPKVEAAGHIRRAAADLGAAIPIIALIETASGLWNIGEIAAEPGAARLAFGSVDFEAETGIADDREAMLHVRSRIVLASAAMGKPAPIDGVTRAIGDTLALEADAAHALRIGFRGKLCIHPSQVGPVNAAFSPSAEQVAWAERVLEAAANSDGAGAFRLDGAMIDRPVLLRARAILASTSRIEILP